MRFTKHTTDCDPQLSLTTSSTRSANSTNVVKEKLKLFISEEASFQHDTEQKRYLNQKDPAYQAQIRK